MKGGETVGKPHLSADNTDAARGIHWQFANTSEWTRYPRVGVLKDELIPHIRVYFRAIGGA
jgi:hypothetical protein